MTTLEHTGTACRFETAVRRALGDVSRRLVRRLIDEGAATLNGRTARKGTTVRPGDRIGLPAIPPLTPEPGLPVRVLDVDDAVIVLDKPAPMPTLPLDPRERGTVAGFVVGRWPECRHVGGALTAGVAHRLDTGTSGILLAARTADAWTALRMAFAARAVRKRYLAVVDGVPAVQRITAALGHDRHDPRLMTTRDGGTRRWSAETRIDAVEARGRFALVRVTIRTGVTHQVRAHLASVGAPVVGDTLYGGPPHAAMGERIALHASEIRVPPLGDRPARTWTSATPPALAALLD